MIVLNGCKFAETETEFTESLFCRESTCFGYAKRYKRRIDLTDHQGEPVAVINVHGVLGCATRQPDGKTRYSFMTPRGIGEYQSYPQSRHEPASYCIDHDRIGHIYKR